MIEVIWGSRKQQKVPMSVAKVIEKKFRQQEQQRTLNGVEINAS